MLLLPSPPSIASSKERLLLAAQALLATLCKKQAALRRQETLLLLCKRVLCLVYQEKEDVSLTKLGACNAFITLLKRIRRRAAACFFLRKGKQ